MELTEARTAARSLLAGVRADDPAARERVLAVHPKYAGRDPARLHPRPFHLTDAQLVVALEQGYASWSELSPGERASAPRMTHFSRRAFDEALRRSDSVVLADHYLLALLSPARPTAASEVLAELGATYEAVSERLPKMPSNDEAQRGVRSSPRQQVVESFGEALALARGARRPSDEDLLLALAYEPELLGRYDLDPDEIYDLLAARGVLVPPRRPPGAPQARGPMGPRVYTPREHMSAVSNAMSDAYPPGAPSTWGMNWSKWKPGFGYHDAEDDIDLPAIARAALPPGVEILVVPLDEAIEAEAAARDD